MPKDFAWLTGMTPTVTSETIIIRVFKLRREYATVTTVTSSARRQRLRRRNLGTKKSAPSGEAQGTFGSPPPELPNHVLILCPSGTTVNVTSVMSTK